MEMAKSLGLGQLRLEKFCAVFPTEATHMRIAGYFQNEENLRKLMLKVPPTVKSLQISCQRLSSEPQQLTEALMRDFLIHYSR